MHVVILPSWYFPAGSREISGRMFHQLGKGLRAKGEEVELFFADFSRKQSFLKRTSFSSEDGLPTYRVSQWFPPKANSFLFNWWARKVVRHFKLFMDQHGKPELLHAQSYHAAAVCLELKKEFQIPFIYTERLSSFLTGKIPKHHLPFISEILSNADLITCVSEGLKEKLNSLMERPVTVVPNFFDEKIFFPDPALQKTEAFTFISVGEPAYTKGLDILIKAFAALKNKMPGSSFQLILADNIPEKKELRALAEALGIAQHISWTGLISQSELAAQLRRSHIYVSASRFETFGKATIEAQGCGLPVIATNTAGSKSIMQQDFQGTLCEIENVDALVAAMENAFTHYTFFSPEKIAQYALEQYGSNIILQKWISLYKTVLA